MTKEAACLPTLFPNLKSLAALKSVQKFSGARATFRQRLRRASRAGKIVR